VHKNNVDLIEISNKEKLAFLTGVNTALNKKEIPGWEDQLSAMAALMEERWAPVKERLDQERKTATIEFFADLAKKENVKKTSTGLFYELISEGTGKFPPNADSVVSAEYSAYLIDGSVIDSTANKGDGGPVPVILANMVPGVREGLQYVREGGIIHLWVPASLGFGNDPGNGIPPDSALMFEFTVHEILATETIPNPDQP
jgi:FKBP-type peptidyl-prolyl cis-trans isomerase FkpA